MKISILTVFPELFEQFIATSVIARSIEKGLVSIDLFKFSDFCVPKERIDEPTCGAGPGMIIKPVVVERALMHIEQQSGTGYRIFFSPQGQLINQPLLRALASAWFARTARDVELSGGTEVTPTNKKSSPAAIIKTYPARGIPPHITHLILVCARYEGMDARVEAAYADAILSVGDYVVMGGDLPAQIFLEGLLRLMPGVLGSQESHEQESFETALLEHPEFGLPVEWHGQRVPEVILSGNHNAIKQWRQDHAVQRTALRRFDWFRAGNPSDKEIEQIKKYIPAHYVVLMHTDVIVQDDQIGVTSVGTLNMHDIARTSITYGVRSIFIVTPLEDQQIILDEFMRFWLSDEGKAYNPSRHRAMSCVMPVRSYEEAARIIKEQEQGKDPLVIATCAKRYDGPLYIDYFSQSIVWRHQRPIVMMFGTGKGLSERRLQQCDYILLPIYGMTDYNHLSVRAAVAIILDRWLGLQPKLCQFWSKSA